MSETLDQKEIDEMLMSIAKTQTADNRVGKANALTPMEIDTLGEIGNISMGAAATALYAIIGRQVNITTPDVKTMTFEELSKGHSLPLVMVDVGYTEGFAGSNLFILQMDDVKVITDIMMGGDGNPGDEELSELHISAISEAMNQMMGGMATSMAELFNRIVSISPPRAVVARLSDQEIHTLISSGSEELIRIKFKIEIEGILNSSIMQLIPIDFGRQLVGELTGPSAQASAESPHPKAAPAQQPADVRTVQLPSFDVPESIAGTGHEAGLEMILDVPLQITVELGQCRKTIKDIMDFHIGSIVTLDKLPGEPVDVIVNGKAVARGEVIVIDDNYGIRVTEVLSSAGRVRATR